MANEAVRASAGWLRLREPADAAARSAALVDVVRTGLRAGSVAVIHDLGCGSGSMARWLAPRLPGSQRWLLVDRDDQLLGLAAADPPLRASDGATVSARTRRGDVTRMDPADLAGATLLTASALLDMLTAEELHRLVATAATARCPVLIALSVTGKVELTPWDPFDRRVAAAFNAHQRRATHAGHLLGPDAVGAAIDAFGRHDFDVVARTSPWRLGAADRDLIRAWFIQWLAAACEQEPELRAEAAAYSRRRLDEAAAGRLQVLVGHTDLLARPSPATHLRPGGLGRG